MKNLKRIIVGLSFFFFTALSTNMAFANDGRNIENEEKLRTEVLALMDIDHLQQNSLENETAIVKFMLTKNNEIIVLNVNTKSDYLDDYFKSKLNYKKVIIDGLDKTEIYTIKIRFTQ